MPRPFTDRQLAAARRQLLRLAAEHRQYAAEERDTAHLDPEDFSDDDPPGALAEYDAANYERVLRLIEADQLDDARTLYASLDTNCRETILDLAPAAHRILFPDANGVKPTDIMFDTLED